MVDVAYASSNRSSFAKLTVRVLVTVGLAWLAIIAIGSASWADGCNSSKACTSANQASPIASKPSTNGGSVIAALPVPAPTTVGTASNNNSQIPGASRGPENATTTPGPVVGIPAQVGAVVGALQTTVGTVSGGLASGNLPPVASPNSALSTGPAAASAPLGTVAQVAPRVSDQPVPTESAPVIRPDRAAQSPVARSVAPTADTAASLTRIALDAPAPITAAAIPANSPLPIAVPDFGNVAAAVTGLSANTDAALNSVDTVATSTVVGALGATRSITNVLHTTGLTVPLGNLLDQTSVAVERSVGLLGSTGADSTSALGSAFASGSAASGFGAFTRIGNTGSTPLPQTSTTGPASRPQTLSTQRTSAPLDAPPQRLTVRPDVAPFGAPPALPIPFGIGAPGGEPGGANPSPTSTGGAPAGSTFSDFALRRDGEGEAHGDLSSPMPRTDSEGPGHSPD